MEAVKLLWIWVICSGVVVVVVAGASQTKSTALDNTTNSTTETGGGGGALGKTALGTKTTNSSKLSHSLYNQFKTDYLKKVDYKSYFHLRNLNAAAQGGNSSAPSQPAQPPPPPAASLTKSTNTTFGGSYYMVGVLFMVFIIGLLIYVNLCNELCLRDTCLYISKWPACFFVRYLFFRRRRRGRGGKSKVHGGGFANNNHERGEAPSDVAGMRVPNDEDDEPYVGSEIYVEKRVGFNS